MNILFLKIGVINVKAAALRNVVTCRYKSRQCPKFWGEKREFFAAQGMWLSTRFSHYTKCHFFIQIFETNCNIPVFLLSHTHCVFQRPLRQFIWLYCENTCSGVESKEGCKQRCFENALWRLRYCDVLIHDFLTPCIQSSILSGRKKVQAQFVPKDFFNFWFATARLHAYYFNSLYISSGIW